MSTDYRAELNRLLTAAYTLLWQGESPANPGSRLILTVHLEDLEDCAARARAALSQPEPVAPTDEAIMELMPQQFRDDLATVSRLAAHGTSPDVTPGIFRVSLNTGALDFARAVLDRWGNYPVKTDSSPDNTPTP